MWALDTFLTAYECKSCDATMNVGSWRRVGDHKPDTGRKAVHKGQVAVAVAVRTERC